MTESIRGQRISHGDPEYLHSASLESRDKKPKVLSSVSIALSIARFCQSELELAK
jgi:hypothetical protein